MLNDAVICSVEEAGMTEVMAAVASMAISERSCNFCRGRLAEYKIPKTIVFLERIPRTESGKVDKKAIGGLCD